jgi:hypothetical protein
MPQIARGRRDREGRPYERRPDHQRGLRNHQGGFARGLGAPALIVADGAPG